MEEQPERNTPVPDEQKELEHISQDLEEEQEHLTEDQEDQDLVGRSLSTTPDSGVDLLENDQEVIKNEALTAVEENVLINQLSAEFIEDEIKENELDICSKQTDSEEPDQITKVVPGNNHSEDITSALNKEEIKMDDVKAIVTENGLEISEERTVVEDVYDIKNEKNTSVVSLHVDHEGKITTQQKETKEWKDDKHDGNPDQKEILPDDEGKGYKNGDEKDIQNEKELQMTSNKPFENDPIDSLQDNIEETDKKDSSINNVITPSEEMGEGRGTWYSQQNSLRATFDMDHGDQEAENQREISMIPKLWSSSDTLNSNKEESTDKYVRTPHPASRLHALAKQESEDINLSLQPNVDSPQHLEDEEDLKDFNWDSEEERPTLDLEDGIPLKVKAWDTNSDHGKYLIGLDAERVIVEGMRKKLETNKTLLTPAHSNHGSVFNYSPTMQRSSASMYSLSSYAGEREDVTKDINDQHSRQPSSKSVKSMSESVTSRTSFSNSMSSYNLSSSWQGVGALKNIELTHKESDQDQHLNTNIKTYSNNNSRSSSVSNFSGATQENSQKVKGPVVKKTVKGEVLKNNVVENKPKKDIKEKSKDDVQEKKKKEIKGTKIKDVKNKAKESLKEEERKDNNKKVNNNNDKLSPSESKSDAKSPSKSRKTSVVSSRRCPSKNRTTKEPSETENKKDKQSGDLTPPKTRTSSIASNRSKQNTSPKKSLNSSGTVKPAIERKKSRGRKSPPPPTDKEKFESLFDMYCNWGSDNTTDEDKGITAVQLTKWLRNVNIVDGKKVTNRLSCQVK